MSRPLRIEYPGAHYHVMNRGIRRKRIYLSQEDFKLFLKVLSESCAFFNVFIHSYCLMPNHYHLLVCTPEGNLSRFMRHLNGVYTQRFNRGHTREGPLFRGRYKSILVQDNEYIKKVVRYIHLEPIEAKMVKRLNYYKWSAHPFYVKGKSLERHIDINSVLGQFALKRKDAIDAYKEFMADKIDEEIKRFYSKKNQSSILGKKSFVQRIKEKYIYGDNGSHHETKVKRSIQGERKNLRILKTICREFKITKHDIYRSRRGEENIPRLMAISLSRELTGFSFSEIAKKYHIISSMTVGTSCYRLSQKMRLNKKLASLYEKIKRKCSQR